MCAPGRYKHGITGVLIDAVRPDVVLPIQHVQLGTCDVEQLTMDGIVDLIRLVMLFEERSQG